MRLVLTCLFFLLALTARAEQVSLEIDGLTAYASYQSGTAAAPVYLIQHGTWAHYGMELIAAMQASLADRGYASLAPNLTLGLDRRQGFRDCRPPFPRHQDAVGEIGAWVDYLAARGHREVIVVGHSRGGAQVASYLTDPAPVVVAGALLAPMVFRGAEQGARFAEENGMSLAAAAASTDEAGYVGPVRLLQCEDVRVALTTLMSYYGEVPEKHTPRLLEAIGVPVTVYLGADDEISRWTNPEIDAARSADHVTLHQIEGAGHFFRDLYLEDVLDLLVPAP